MEEDNGNTPRRLIAEEPVDQLVTECAFLVYLNEGHWVADDDPSKIITIGRKATFNDFFNAAVTIQKDITATETANRIMIMQQQMAMQMAQQVQANKAGVPGGIDLSNLRQK